MSDTPVINDLTRPAAPITRDEARAQPEKALQIASGYCHVLYSYDIGLSIDLDQCARLVSAMTQREPIKHKKRAPTKYSEPQSLPLRVTLEAEVIDLGPASTLPTIELIVHDFGVVTVQYNFNIVGPFDRLLGLSDRLYDNQQLLEASRAQVNRLFEMIRPAVARPAISRPVEDFTTYEIRACDPPLAASDIFGRYRHMIAQILRSETAAISEQEVEDALSSHISFGPNDLAIIDWNGAMLFDRSSDDTRTVLELANAELLEMRFLDEQLDHLMEDAYRSLVVQRERASWRLRRATAADLRRIARLQVDNALLFEGVHNALKLLGDQFLARVYRLASQRFHLREWDESIVRKLQTLESIYQKLTDRASSLRMEVLEWIIIVLIAFEIVLTFFPWKH